MNGPGSQQRMIVALLIIAGAAIGVGLTMEPGKYRALAWVLLGFFAFRILITRLRATNPKSRAAWEADYQTSGYDERQKLLKVKHHTRWKG